MMRRLILAAALALAAVAGVPPGADASTDDLGTYGARSWGAAVVDIDIVAGGQRISYWLDDIDPPADGYCVRLYVYVLAGQPNAGWRHLATSCGPPTQAVLNITATPGYGNIDATVRVVRGTWGGSYFSIFNSMV